MKKTMNPEFSILKENNKEKEKDQESLKNILENIKPSEYSNLDVSEEYLKIKEDLPKKFWEKIKDADQEDNLMQVLLRIREDLYDLYGDKKNNAKSLSDSRFIPLEEMIDRHLISCGSLTKIFGTILRNFNIPVKFIHGTLERQKRSSRRSLHSWLKIYNPKENKWIAIDLTNGSLELSSNAKEIKEYIDWEEFKEDYEKGDF